MYITRIYIENFKSIKKIDINPNKGLNAFIGENSTGKSNIFKALDWLLGKTYPTFNQITKQDHFMGDDNNKIIVILEFDDGVKFEINENLEQKFKITKIGTSIRSDDETRKKYCSSYLDTKREINDFMPSNKWSLLGRILQEVNSQFSDEVATINGESKLKKTFLKDYLCKIKDNLLFTVNDKDGVNVMKKLTEILQTETANQLNRNKDEFSIDFNLYDPWNFYRTLQILVKEENGLEFQASELGMGVQASISIAILKAYSELNLNNNSPIFIDEPELYLHPQAQRNFYKILRKISENQIDNDTGEYIKIGTQIFYTTHSPDFLNAGNFNEIFLVRKSKTDGTYTRNAELKNFLKDLKIRKHIDSSESDFLMHMQQAYNETGDTQKANEGFFAKKILLVEGQSETMVLPYLFEIAEFDYIKEGVTIVRCGCKSEIDRFYRLYNELGIPCFIIFDGDKQSFGTDDYGSTVEKNKALFSFLDPLYMDDFPDNTVKEKYLGFEFRFDENLGITGLGENIKALALYKKCKENITSKENLPAWVNDVILRLNSLSHDNTHSILKTEQPD